MKRADLPLIVGIGASAGGLEAFRTFFANMPPDSGMAFILVQHLAPDHKSMLAEIIGRSTSMERVRHGPVHPAETRESIAPARFFLQTNSGISAPMNRSYET